MNQAEELARDLCRELEGHPGFGGARESKQGREKGVDTHESAGVARKKGEKRQNQKVLIEVELRGIAPAGNVIPVWKRVNEGKYSGHLDMLQAFSALHPPNSTPRRNAELLGKQMEKACGVQYVR